MGIGKERNSPRKTEVPKLYAYNECKHYVVGAEMCLFELMTPKKNLFSNHNKLSSPIWSLVVCCVGVFESFDSQSV